MSAADFEPARARCSLFARHGGSGFVAVGSENYVAGAALGHAIGESIRAQRDFNDCMSASGWIADGQALSAPIQPATASFTDEQWNTVRRQCHDEATAQGAEAGEFANAFDGCMKHHGY
jgi:hypothetical protein